MNSKKEAAYLFIVIGLFVYIIFQNGNDTVVPNSGLNLRVKSPIEMYKPQSDTLVNLLEVANSEFTLVIYFTGEDCYSCLQEFKMWNRLASEYSPKKLQIVGMYPAGEEADVLASELAESIQFNIFRDPGNIQHQLQMFQTPSKMLIGPYGYVRFFDGPNQQRHYQKQFYTAVTSIVGIPISKTF